MPSFGGEVKPSVSCRRFARGLSRRCRRGGEAPGGASGNFQSRANAISL
jgi:hypothetical protein